MSTNAEEFGRWAGATDPMAILHADGWNRPCARSQRALRLFAVATAKTWTPAMALAGEVPALLREHVFDFHDGLRMIASMTDLGRGAGPRLHVSCSWSGGTPFAAMAQAMEPTALHAQVAARFNRISGLVLPPPVGVSAKGVMHFTETTAG